MTQQQRENRIKELEKQIEELKAMKVEEPQQSKRWKPNKDEEYWCVTNRGEVGLYDWCNNDFDNWLYLIGNCFQTEEEAEEYKKQIEYTARYKNYIEEHSGPFDWSSDNNQIKYIVVCDSGTEEIGYVSTYFDKFQGTIYAKNRQIIEEAIKEIGEENFKKYVLGVI